MKKSLSPAPPHPVDGGEFLFGRYAGTFERVNFLDVKKLWNHEPPAWMKTWRLKEWRSFLLGDDRWTITAALFNAKLFTIAFFSAWERESGLKYSFTRTMPGGVVHLGDRFRKSHCAYHGRHARMDFDLSFPEETGRLLVNWRPGHHEQGFHGEFHFKLGPKFVAPSTAVLPLGNRRAMYSTKLLMPMQGFFESGGFKHEFKEGASSALFDDHKGYYSFGLRYDWVGGFGTDTKKRRIGLSLTSSAVKESGWANENSLWIGNKLWPLPPVRITRAEGYEGDWVVQDTEGLVDLVFTPKSPNDINFHLGLIETDWHGPFGSFKGTIKTGEGESVDAELLVGMGEEKYLRA